MKGCRLSRVGKCVQVKQSDAARVLVRGQGPHPGAKGWHPRACRRGGVLWVWTGYFPVVTDAVEPCSFPPCGQPTAVTLRMVVEGEDLVLPVCHGHANWMTSYVLEDDAARVVDLVPVEASSPPDDGALALAEHVEPPEHERHGDGDGVHSEH